MGSRRADAAICLALFVVAVAVGAGYTRLFERTHPPAEPWVRELSAAIAFACGHGYSDLGYAPSPAVDAFLAKKIDAVTCDAVPLQTSFAAPNFTQRLYRYMTLAVGVTWRLFGISWTTLSILFGVLYGASALATYGLFRLAADRAMSVAGALILIVSPLQLRYLPQLRDYAKAPFILTLILLAAVLVFRPFDRRRLLLCAAGYGAVMGIGFGFRNDLLINILPFVVTIALFLPVPARAQVAAKLAALGLCAATFLACAWPIVRAYESGSNTGHVAVLGLMTHFDAPLGVTESVYDWGEPYDDGYAIKVISSFAQRVEHREVVALSPEYDAAALRLLLVILRNWPADVVTRAYASVLKIVELPFQIRSYTPAVPPGLDARSVASLYAAWDGVLSRMGGLGVLIVGVAVAAVAATGVRLALWTALALLYFAGYPALQFDARHFFFLEFVPWLGVVILAGGAAKRLSEGAWRSRIRRGVAFAAVAAACLVGTEAVLRAYQQRHVARLLDEYIAAPMETLALERVPIGDGKVLLRPTTLSHEPEPAIRAEYIVVEVQPRACGRIVVPITFRYVMQDTYTDLSQEIFVPPSDASGATRVFVPIYYAPGGYFSGVETTEAAAACLGAVRRVTDLTRTAVLLNLTLPPDWRRMPLYQTVTRWEPPSAPYRVRVYSWPRKLDVSALDLMAAPLPSLPESHSRLVSAESDRWIARGLVRDSTSMILRLPDRVAPERTCFFVRGTLYRGGLTVGLLRHDAWATTVNVTAPGEFLAVVEAPEGGRYAPAVANFLTGINRWTDFVVSGVGWARPAR